MKSLSQLFISGFIMVILFSVPSLSAQEEEPSYEDLPMGFSGLTMGREMEEIKDLLTENFYFDYQGDPDVSMLMNPDTSIIECDGRNFIERAYFQFYRNKLYTITLVLNRKETDYYTMMTTFEKKYGPFKYLKPEETVWENEIMRISIEKPLTVKYIDLTVFNQLKEEGELDEAFSDTQRKRFIDEF